MQLKGLHGVNFLFLIVTREHVLKMNVVLIKECTQTQNAFSVDRDRD